MAQQCLPFDQIVNYTCSTEATYIGREPDGLGGYNYVIKTAQPNEPRFPYDPETGEKLGLLNEPSSENLLLHSEDFTQSAWSKIGSTTATLTSIQNPVDGAVFNRLSGLGEVGDRLQQVVSFTDTGQIFSAAFHAKADVGETITAAIIFTGGTTYAPNRVRFDLRDGSYEVVGSPSPTSITTELLADNTWEITISQSANNSGNTTANLRIYQEPMTSNPALGDVLCTAAQIEQGYPTSYIPTTTSSVVRDATKSYLNPALFSKERGSLYFDGVIEESTTGDTQVISFGDGSVSTDGIFIRCNGDGGVDFINSSGGSIAASSQKIQIALGERHKLFCTYGGGKIKGFIDGEKVFDSNSFVPPINITAGRVLGNPFSDNTAHIGTCREAVVSARYVEDDAEAIALTTLEPEA